MQHRVAIVGTAAIPVGRHQRVAVRVIGGEAPPELDKPVGLVAMRYTDGPLFAARPVRG